MNRILIGTVIVSLAFFGNGQADGPPPLSKNIFIPPTNQFASFPSIDPEGRNLLLNGVLTTNDVRQCATPEIKEVVDKYILSTNRPPWLLYGP